MYELWAEDIWNLYPVDGYFSSSQQFQVACSSLSKVEASELIDYILNSTILLPWLDLNTLFLFLLNSVFAHLFR